MSGDQGVRIRLAAILGPEVYDLGESVVSSMDEARLELPALLRRVADEYEQTDLRET